MINDVWIELFDIVNKFFFDLERFSVFLQNFKQCFNDWIVTFFHDSYVVNTKKSTKFRQYFRIDNEEFRLVSVIKFFSKLLSKIRVFEIMSFSN
jgi:hypothetical protein